MASIEEHNRSRLSRASAPRHLVQGLVKFCDNEDLVCTALWALVIICRPLGGVEGETLTSFVDENFANVKRLKDNGGVAVVIEMMRKEYRENPRVLAKAFWLVVNLALVEEVKAFMIDRHVIRAVLNALRYFPENRELNYRACFALINLSIRDAAKRQVFELDGVKLILGVMRKFKDSSLMIKCCCNVLRSLMVGDTHGIRNSSLPTAAMFC